MVSEEIKVFLMALMPILETRMAIPFGIAVANLPALEVLVVAMIGNVIPAPPLLWGLSSLERWALSGDGGVRGVIASLYRKILHKIRSRGERYIKRYGLLGLALFVAIPLPGSGVWTGCALAHVLGLEPHRALASIVVGALAAGLMILAGTLGLISLI